MLQFTILSLFLAGATWGELDCDFIASYPKHYVTSKLGEKDKIVIDGKLNEDAWKEVPFSDDFVDIR